MVNGFFDVFVVKTLEFSFNVLFQVLADAFKAHTAIFRRLSISKILQQVNIAQCNVQGSQHFPNNYFKKLKILWKKMSKKVVPNKLLSIS